MDDGFTNVYGFFEGYNGWCEAGFYFVVSGTQLKGLIDAGYTDQVEYTLIDVREAYEFADGWIPGAVNVPLSRIKTATSREDLQDLLPAQYGNCDDWRKPLIVYCAGMGTRYDEAARKLAELGYIRLVAFPGGTNEWTNTLGEFLVTN